MYNHGNRFMLGSALPLILLRTIAGKINPLVLISIKIIDELLFSLILPCIVTPELKIESK